MPLLRLLLVSATALVYCASVETFAAERAKPATAKLTAEQRAEVRTALATLRKAKVTPDEQDQSVGRLLEIGGPAVDQLQVLLRADLDRQIKNYAQRFGRQAAAAAGARFSRQTGVEIKSLREKVLSMVGREGLTEEIIKREADPAMARLREIFHFDRQAVLEKAPDLKTLLTKMEQSSGRLWERCRAHLAEHPTDQQPPADPMPSFTQLVQLAESAAIAEAMPLDAATRTTYAANSQLAAKLDAEEASAIAACNEVRGLLGLAPLAIDLQLCAAARDHSKDMEKQDFFSHKSPVPGKADPPDRARNFGTTAAGENIYKGRVGGREVNDGWFHSPPHQKNLLGGFARIGVGRSGKLYTEMFGK